MLKGAAPLDFEAALTAILQHARTIPPGEAAWIDLLASQGRILASPLLTDRDHPPFDRSTRDGFAIRTADASGQLTLIGQLRAGQLWTGPALARDQTIEIMTGAPLPPGADAVLMVEHAEQTGTTVQSTRTLSPGENIVRQGSEARAGDLLLPAGTLIGPAEIALGAACGHPRLVVFRKPTVAIIATGDELVELDKTPQPPQIRNSNSYALAALVQQTGGEPLRLPIARDRTEDLHHAIAAARTADLLLLSGGVSMGQYDLVENVLHTLGAKFFFTGVRMQPGKPVVFGQLPATPKFAALPFFGLPGNPISTQVTFHAFAAPLLRALCGAPAAPPPYVLATLAQDLPGNPNLTRLLPAQLTGTEVQLVPWQGSGDQAANARANCYLLLPADREQFAAGEIVRVLLQ